MKKYKPKLPALTINECQRLSGKSLIEAYMLISFDDKLTKHEVIERLNNEASNNYNANHLNNWIAGRKPIPHNIQSVMRKAVIRYLFGDEVAEILKGIY